MDLTQAHDLNTIAAAFDNREPSTAADTAWAAALTHLGVEFADAEQAIIEHYAESNDWIMPADVGYRATAIRRNREHAARREADQARHALPAAPPNPTVRDRTEDLRTMVNNLMGQYRNWDPIGDPDMRRRQTHSPNPEARLAADEASRAKARAIVAESRARRNAEQANLDQDTTRVP